MPALQRIRKAALHFVHPGSMLALTLPMLNGSFVPMAETTYCAQLRFDKEFVPFGQEFE